MKQTIICAITALTLVACSNQPGFTIKGNCGEYDGIAVLSYLDPLDETKVSDTVVMSAGAFEFNGNVAEPVRGSISVIPQNETPIVGLFYVENAVILFAPELEGIIDQGQYGKYFSDPNVSGGTNNDFTLGMVELLSAIDTEEQYAEYVKAVKEADKLSFKDYDSYTRMRTEIEQKYGKELREKYFNAQKDAILAYCLANPDVEALSLIHNIYTSSSTTLEEKEEAFAKFSERVRKSYLAKDLREEIEALRAVQPGALAPDFTLKDRDDNDVTLSSLRGQYVLVDFWASWCSPCRAGMPALKELYEKYHDKGFEIIGVSNDTSYDKWVKAIDEDQTPWVHVIDEFPVENSSARVISSYAVHFIPSYFLLDKDGRVIGNLTHEEIEAKLQELLD